MPTPPTTPTTTPSGIPETTTPGGSPTSSPSTDPQSMARITNTSRPLPCRDNYNVSVGLGIITPCLFLSICLNCYLYNRLKNSESNALFERFRRSLHRGESDRLLDSADSDERTDRPTHSTYQRSGVKSARTRSLVRPQGHVNPAFDPDTFAVTSL